MPDDETEWVTYREAEEILGVREAAVRRRAKKYGVRKVYRVDSKGRGIRLARADVEKIAAGTAEPMLVPAPPASQSSDGAARFAHTLEELGAALRSSSEVSNAQLAALERAMRQLRLETGDKADVARSVAGLENALQSINKTSKAQIQSLDQVRRRDSRARSAHGRPWLLAAAGFLVAIVTVSSFLIWNALSREMDHGLAAATQDVASTLTECKQTTGQSRARSEREALLAYKEKLDQIIEEGSRTLAKQFEENSSALREAYEKRIAMLEQKLTHKDREIEAKESEIKKLRLHFDSLKRLVEEKLAERSSE